MKNKTRFFKSIAYSISKPPFAIEMIEKRSGIAYLTLLSLLISAVLSLAFLFNLYVVNDIDNVVLEMRETIPNFELKNGKLNIDIDEPIIMDNGQSLIIVDSGYNEPLLKQYEKYSGQKIYINQDFITIYQGSQVRILNFEDFPYYLTRESFIGTIQFFIRMAVVFYFIGKFIGLLLTGMFMALIVAVFGAIVSSANNVGLSFKNLYTLSVFSITALYLLEGIMNFLNKVSAVNIPSHLHFGISYLSMGLFVYFYIDAIRKHKQNEQENNVNPLPLSVNNVTNQEIINVDDNQKSNEN